MRLFLDMDGVLTDFDKQAAKLFDISKDEVQEYLSKHSKLSWFKIDHAGKDFWEKMDWMPDGKQLWEGLEIYKPTILSSPTRHDSSFVGKKGWLGKNIGDRYTDGAFTILDHDKAKYATGKCDILIDDRDKNITAWEKAGGTGILHSNTRDTLKNLNELLSTGKYSSTQKEVSVVSHITDTMDRIASTLENKGLLKEAEELDALTNTVEKLAKDKWIQKAVPKKDEGKFGDWCKANGFEEGVSQSCINKAIAKGGKPAQMANFAINVSKGKYSQPDGKK